MHYKLTTETKVYCGITLYRIGALVDLPQHKVKAGDKGGWIQSTSNLWAEAWVFGNAWVYGDAQVYGSAQVSGNARVNGNAVVYGKAKLRHSSDIHCISGYSFHITRTRGYAVIGCKRLSIKQWMAMPLKEAIELGLPAEEYETIRKLLRLTRIK